MIFERGCVESCQNFFELSSDVIGLIHSEYLCYKNRSPLQELNRESKGYLVVYYLP